MIKVLPWKIFSISDQDSPTSIVLTCGYGFRTRPGHDSDNDGQMKSYGVLLIWDSAMPRIKSQFDEIRKEQAPYT